MMFKKVIVLLCVIVITTNYGQSVIDANQVKSQKGFFNILYNEVKDRLYLEVNKIDQDFLFVHGLRTGLGSNDIGLDRGQLGGTRIVHFKKSGNRLLLIQSNTSYRADTSNALEKQSVTEAFAQSVLFGFPIVETQGDKYIIDITPFMFEDRHGVANRLKRQGQGSFSIDKSRSALEMERTKSFIDNTEFEALITYKGKGTGANLRSVAPDVNSFSLIQHYSFIKLPDNNFVPRKFDPRSGSLFTSYLDYASPVEEPIVKRFVNRHRLIKKDVNLALSEAVHPIVYYLDSGTPEPIRSALLEGASWWNQAFEAAGFSNAFQVKMLPPDADPMDVRYNTIQWVHRSTRGWSYGATITDPRTGEIIKGHVSLGSLRIRQDYMLAQAFIKNPFSNISNQDPMLAMALARIRQLSAHEVGHTLGFAHNFAASAKKNASVMDYPHPMFLLQGDQIDVTKAYATGIGDWDKITVKYSYGTPDRTVSESEYLNTLLDTASKDGFQFITDADARAKGGAHVDGHLWDNGQNAVDALNQMIAVRKQAIANFSIDNIKAGTPLTVLENVFAPLYFSHRYQTEAAVKSIGGLNYEYAIKGSETAKPFEVLAVAAQKKAVKAILKTLSVPVLAIPRHKLSLFMPRAYGYSRGRENFKSNSGVAFDPFGAVATASDMTLSLLLHPERVERLWQQKALAPNQIGLEEVLNSLVESTISKTYKDTYHQAIQNVINQNVVNHILRLALHENTTATVKAFAKAQLLKIKNVLAMQKTVHSDALLDMIADANKNPSTFKTKATLKIPDGSPIGCY